MKKQKIYLSITHIRLRQRKIERLRRKSVEKKRQRNIISNSKRKAYKYKEEKHRGDSLFQRPKQITVSCEQNLSLLENPENVLDLIKKIEDVTTINRKVILTIDLKQVTNIDIGSISILLAKINKLISKNIVTICSLPQDSNCKKMFFESGFSDHMRDLQ